jgi:hypothetical protein
LLGGHSSPYFEGDFAESRMNLSGFYRSHSIHCLLRSQALLPIHDLCSLKVNGGLREEEEKGHTVVIGI